MGKSERERGAMRPARSAGRGSLSPAHWKKKVRRMVEEIMRLPCSLRGPCFFCRNEGLCRALHAVVAEWRLANNG